MNINLILQVENFVNKHFSTKTLIFQYLQLMKINANGFREYDARWLYEKDVDLEGITDLGKGLGTQVINHTHKKNVPFDIYI